MSFRPPPQDATHPVKLGVAQTSPSSHGAPQAPVGVSRSTSPSGVPRSALPGPHGGIAPEAALSVIQRQQEQISRLAQETAKNAQQTSLILNMLQDIQGQLVASKQEPELATHPSPTGRKRPLDKSVAQQVDADVEYHSDPEVGRKLPRDSQPSDDVVDGIRQMFLLVPNTIAGCQPFVVEKLPEPADDGSTHYIHMSVVAFASYLQTYLPVASHFIFKNGALSKLQRQWIIYALTSGPKFPMLVDRKDRESGNKSRRFLIPTFQPSVSVAVIEGQKQRPNLKFRTSKYNPAESSTHWLGWYSNDFALLRKEIQRQIEKQQQEAEEVEDPEKGEPKAYESFEQIRTFLRLVTSEAPDISVPYLQSIHAIWPAVATPFGVKEDSTYEETGWAPFPPRSLIFKSHINEEEGNQVALHTGVPIPDFMLSHDFKSVMLATLPPPVPEECMSVPPIPYRIWLMGCQQPLKLYPTEVFHYRKQTYPIMNSFIVRAVLMQPHAVLMTLCKQPEDALQSVLLADNQKDKKKEGPATKKRRASSSDISPNKRSTSPGPRSSSSSSHASPSKRHG